METPPPVASEGARPVRDPPPARGNGSLRRWLLTLTGLALLLAGLVPVSIGARERREDALCRARLVPLAMALKLYAADHDGRLPPAGSELRRALARQGVSAEGWVCPSGGGYRLNAQVAGRRLGDLPAAHHTIVLFEAGEQGLACFPHRAGTNCAFADGSVRWLEQRTARASLDLPMPPELPDPPAPKVAAPAPAPVQPAPKAAPATKATPTPPTPPATPRPKAARTVRPGPSQPAGEPPEPKSWQTVTSFVSRGQGTTEAFTVQPPWRVRWQTEADRGGPQPFRLTLVTPAGKLVRAVGSAWGEGADQVDLGLEGTYRLRVETSQGWRIAVEERR